MIFNDSIYFFYIKYPAIIFSDYFLCVMNIYSSIFYVNNITLSSVNFSYCCLFLLFLFPILLFFLSFLMSLNCQLNISHINSKHFISILTLITMYLNFYHKNVYSWCLIDILWLSMGILSIPVLLNVIIIIIKFGTVLSNLSVFNELI